MEPPPANQTLTQSEFDPPYICSLPPLAAPFVGWVKPTALLQEFPMRTQSADSSKDPYRMIVGADPPSRAKATYRHKAARWWVGIRINIKEDLTT